MATTVQTAWDDLARELDAWRAAGQMPRLWWRDDDAVADTAALRRLLDLAGDAGVPLALAVIPGLLEDSLPPLLADRTGVDVLCHGHVHANHAPSGEKKAEFGGHRPVYELLAEAAMGFERLAAAVGTGVLPVFVPPWNRLDERLVGLLHHARFTGLSRFGARRAAHPAPVLVEVNCHVDPVDWRGDRGFLGVPETLARLTGHLRARRTGTADAAEPTGLLTHHLVTDAAGWDFLADLLGFFARRDGGYWLSAGEAFSVTR
jgi:hypothetical protein